MIIAIVSGKGGTGKTAIATSLAAILGERGQLMDCDVENPNSYLYIKPKNVKEERATIEVPEIDLEKCTHCGKCVEACQYGALADIGAEFLFFDKLCHSCAACWTVCPEDAITPVGREYGTITMSESAYGADFVQGKLDVSEVLTPTLIYQVKEKTDKNKITIIDGPPGAGCPLYAVLEDVDFTILVTEPTAFGYHDLERALELVKKAEVDAGIIINRSTVGNAPIKELGAKFNVPVILEIPYDDEIAKNYSRGAMLVSIKSELKEELSIMLEHIIDNTLEEIQ
ncbi:MAG: nucleotide-binding protein [Candidatus Kariarchaeaceae archaeon]